MHTMPALVQPHVLVKPRESAEAPLLPHCFCYSYATAPIVVRVPRLTDSSESRQ
jgi:hypothetical protein